MYKRLLNQFVFVGWVSVLNGWLNSSDLSIACMASKALANMDKDADAYSANYLDGVHLYHPQYRDRYSEPSLTSWLITLSFV